MQILERSKIIDLIPKRYKEQYVVDNKWQKCCFGLEEDHEAHYNLLLTATTRERIDEIIGNTSWTDNICIECNGDFEKVIRIGQESDFESATYLCIECVKRALIKLEEKA